MADRQRRRRRLLASEAAKVAAALATRRIVIKMGPIEEEEWRGLSQTAERYAPRHHDGHNIPAIQRTPEQLLDQVRRKRRGLVRAEESDKIAKSSATALLAGQGYDPAGLELEVQQLDVGAHSQLQPMDNLQAPPSQTVDERVADIREELVISAIEATAYANSACVADFLRESMLASWTSKRSLLMEALRGKAGGDGSAKNENVNSNYATAMGKITKAFLDTKSLTPSKIFLAELKPVQSEMKTKYVEPLFKTMSGVLGEGKRERSNSVDMVCSAKKVLQTLFLDKLKEGGMVASSNLSVVEEFVRGKQRNASDYKSEAFHWEVAYFCLRCGLLKEAAEVTAQVEQKMPVLLAYDGRSLDRKPAQRLRAECAEIMNTGRFIAQPFRALICCILSNNYKDATQILEYSHENTRRAYDLIINETYVLDYIWLHLSLARYGDPDNNVGLQDVLTLEMIQDTVFAKSRDEYVRADCPTIWAIMCLLLQKWVPLAEELRRNCGDVSLENDSFHGAVVLACLLGGPSAPDQDAANRQDMTKAFSICLDMIDVYAQTIVSQYPTLAIEYYFLSRYLRVDDIATDVESIEKYHAQAAMDSAVWLLICDALVVTDPKLYKALEKFLGYKSEEQTIDMIRDAYNKAAQLCESEEMESRAFDLYTLNRSYGAALRIVNTNLSKLIENVLDIILDNGFYTGQEGLYGMSGRMVAASTKLPEEMRALREWLKRGETIRAHDFDQRVAYDEAFCLETFTQLTEFLNCCIQKQEIAALESLHKAGLPIKSTQVEESLRILRTQPFRVKSLLPRVMKAAAQMVAQSLAQYRGDAHMSSAQQALRTFHIRADADLSMLSDDRRELAQLLTAA